MNYNVIRVEDYYPNKTIKLWPRCLTAVCFAGCIFYAVYTSVRIPVSERIRHFSEKPECNCGVRRMPGALWGPGQGPRNVLVDTQRLFYNRVPKCGSTTMYTLIRKLAAAHGYVHFNSKVYDRKNVDEDEQRRIVRLVKRTPPPCSFDRHVFFINFTRFGEIPPIYINIIRDPVERIISSFFYRRVVAAKTNYSVRSPSAPARVKPSAYWMNKKFEQCVMDSDPECTFLDGHNYSVLQLPYFCGQEPQCQLLNDPGALQKAKRNIEQSYSVVGVLEHMNVTLQVLEAVLPQFFDGALKIYHSLGVHRNKNLQKQQVSSEVKEILKSNLTAEYTLYDFVLQRLYRQYRETVIR